MVTKRFFLILLSIIVLGVFLPTNITSSVNASYNKSCFEILSTDEGLSDASVFAVFEDSTGYLWLGTRFGLNKYDGLDFEQFFFDSVDLTVTSNVIRDICQDRLGNLWIGTDGGGLNRFDPETEEFTRYLHNPNNPLSLSNDSIRYISQDRLGNLWVGTLGGGLNRFDPETEEFTSYLHDPNDPLSLSNNSVMSICQDRLGNLWIGTDGGGLNRFDPETEEFTSYLHNPNNPLSLSNDSIRCISQDRLGNLWVGTLGGGLNRFDPETEEFTSYLHDPNDPLSLSNNSVMSICQDRLGDLWVGTLGGGLNRFDPEKEEFTSYLHDPNNPLSLSSNVVLSLSEDNSGLLWIGTELGLNKYNHNNEVLEYYNMSPSNLYGLNSDIIRSIFWENSSSLWIGTINGGLNKFNRETGEFTYYIHDPNDSSSLSSNNITSICQDRLGNLWVGTLGGGLNRFDPETEEFTSYLHDPNDPLSISENYISIIYADSSGTLWIGTEHFGLNRFDPETEEFTRYLHNPNNPLSLSNDSIRCISQDRLGNLWVGTLGGGLNRFDPETEEFTSYLHDPNDPLSLSNNSVMSICQDRLGDLWVGTLGGGLNQLNVKSLAFNHFIQPDSIRNNTINSIVQDNDANMWVTTSSDIFKYDRQHGTFHNHGEIKFSQCIQYKHGVCQKTDDGMLIFGGAGGFVCFDPKNINYNLHIPSIVITSIRINGQQISLTDLLRGASKINLNHRENSIAMDFRALDYHDPRNNLYEYKLDGLDEDWFLVGAEGTTAEYTDLKPGDYIFQVKGSNNNGIWNPFITYVAFTINPPFWSTMWFPMLVTAFLVIVILLTLKIRINNAILQKKKLEVLVNKRTLELDKLYKAEKVCHKNLNSEIARRTRFTREIVHEIKTPLTSMLSAAELLVQTNRSNQRNMKLAGHLESAIHDLEHRVDELMDLSRAELNKLRISRTWIDLAQLINNLKENLEPIVKKKGIKLNLLNIQAKNKIWADYERIWQVLFHLIDNSIKYNKRGCIITLKVFSDEKEVFIDVRDNGVGIPKEEQKYVFRPYYRGKKMRSIDGIGLGLPLSRMLIRLHGGDIKIKDTGGKGTFFRISLPNTNISIDEANYNVD